MNFETYIQFALALIIVLGLMALFYLLLKKVNMVQSGMGGKTNRIQIIEQRMVDSKNKAVIIRCDGKDHLVILSPTAHTVIKGDMDTPKETAHSKKDIPVESF